VNSESATGFVWKACYKHSACSMQVGYSRWAVQQLQLTPTGYNGSIPIEEAVPQASSYLSYMYALCMPYQSCSWHLLVRTRSAPAQEHVLGGDFLCVVALCGAGGPDPEVICDTRHGDGSLKSACPVQVAGGPGTARTRSTGRGDVCLIFFEGEKTFVVLQDDKTL